jgi:hypothetical protein
LGGGVKFFQKKKFTIFSCLFWYEFDRYIGQTPNKNLHIPRSKFLIGEYGGLDRSLTNIPIELHTKYLSNFHIKYISDRDQFVLSGRSNITRTIVQDDSDGTIARQIHKTFQMIRGFQRFSNGKYEKYRNF